METITYNSESFDIGISDNDIATSDYTDPKILVDRFIRCLVTKPFQIPLVDGGSNSTRMLDLINQRYSDELLIYIRSFINSAMNFVNDYIKDNETNIVTTYMKAHLDATEVPIYTISEIKDITIEQKASTLEVAMTLVIGKNTFTVMIGGA